MRPHLLTLPHHRLLPFLGAVILLALPATLAAQPRDKKDQPVQPWVPPQQPRPQPYKPAGPLPTMIPVFIGIAIAVWAMQKKIQEEEEEEVTPLSADPTSGFEYKIMRSAMGSFKKPATLRVMLDDEARAGWELFEKLDDCRVRLRRPVACRERDADLTQDPYRTRYSSSDSKVLLWVLLGALAFGAVVAIGIAVGLALSK